MVLDPDTYDRLHALYKRFDLHPEAKFVEGGAVLKTDAYLAFLDLRQAIIPALSAIHAATRQWRPIERYFDDQPETPMVLLWGMNPDSGEKSVMVGYYDADSQAWYREGQGQGDPVIEPVKYMRPGDLSLPEDEFVAIPRLEE